MDHLHNQSAQEELDDLVLCNQRLFFSLVMDNTTSADDNQFCCPVQCFIAACSYNEDDTFKCSNGMTSMLAQWQLLLQVTGLYAADLSVAVGITNSILG